MSNPSGLKITRDYVVYQPREQCVFPIEDADWRRLKRLINNIVPQRRLFEVLSSISFGVFASAILSLVAFYATKDLAPWVLPTTWLTLGCSFVLGISFEMLYRQQHKVSTASVSVILDEMDQLEKDFVSPAENVIDKSEKICGSLIIGVVIVQA
jgi:hypothetical protein